MKGKLALGTFGALVIFGCGGGGGGTVGTGSGSAPVAVFATDNLNRDYDQVWVKIHRVELVRDSGTTTVFEDAAGRVIDLRKLRDASGARFSFLGQRAAPTGTYSAVRVRMGSELTLVPKGNSTGQSRQFAAAYDVPGLPGFSQISFNQRQTVGGSTRLVVDFDLSAWAVDSTTGRVTALVKPGEDRGLDDRTRHEAEDYEGLVSGLSGSAPNQTFRLGEWSVTTSATTRIFREVGAANPVLANGTSVEVRGTFVQGTLKADSIKIEDESGTDDPADLKGLVSSFNAATGQIQVTILRARGFVPSGTRYLVQDSAQTLHLSDAGMRLSREDFYAALTALGASAQVEAEGTVSGTTFSARKLKIEDETETGEAEVIGTVTAEDEAAGTLTVTVTGFFGGSFTLGQSLPVTTMASTEYRDGGRTLTKAQFFAAISSGSRVEVKGTWDGTRLVAERLNPED
jgi:hypothetical protein